MVVTLWRCWGKRRSGGKKMATYRQIYGFGHLRADCQGSAPEPYAPIKHGSWAMLGAA